MNDVTTRLDAIGRQLESAIASAIRHNPAPTGHEHGDITPKEVAMPIPLTTRRRRRIIAAGAITAALAAGAGVAAALGAFSTDEVERGLPGGAYIFTGTNPSCTTSDHVVFQCTLASRPTPDPVLSNGSQAAKKFINRNGQTVKVPLTNPGPVDYLGRVEAITDDTKHIAGGCRGTDHAGLHWTCFVGRRAVTEKVIGPGLLGEFAPVPGVG